VAVAPVASWTLKAALPKLPAAVGVPLTVMVLPLSEAVRPAGRLVAVRPLNGPVPALMVMVPLKPGRLTVQADGDSAPSVGPALTVILYVPVRVAPVASCTVTDALANVPAALGVPVKTTLVPLSTAVRPGGRLDWLTRVSAPVPPVTGMAPL